MNQRDCEAFARAKDTGYLIKDKGVSFQVTESWYVWCKEQCKPMVSVGGKGKYRTIIFDTDPVFISLWMQDKPVFRVPYLAPTERTQERLDALVRQYHGWGNYGTGYSQIHRLAPDDAETVAREMLKLWEEVKIVACSSSLWDEQISEGVIGL